MFSEDLSTFFDDDEFAKPATWVTNAGEVFTGSVIIDEPDVVAFGEAVQFDDLSQLLYVTGLFPDIDEGAVLTVEGQKWRLISKPRRIDDGALMQAALRKGE